MNAMKQSRGTGWVWLLLAAICLTGIVGRELWTPDEPRVACISATVWESSDWVVPRLAGEIFVEKPPLYFWLCGAFGTWLGPVFGFVGAARLSVAFCALGTLLAAAWLGGVLLGRRGGLFTAMALGTMPLFVDYMHLMRVDVLLAFCVAVAVACLAAAYVQRRAWLVPMAGVAAAGAFLCKGPIGVLFIALAWLPLAWPHALRFWNRRRAGEPMGWTMGWWGAHAAAVVLFLGLAGSWVLALWLHEDPAAWRAWFWDNQLGRFQGTVAVLGHRHPWAFWYYIVLWPAVLGFWFPLFVLWLARSGAAAWRGRTAWREGLGTAQGFIGFWAFATLLLLTVAVTKRGVYLLPLHIVYALMVADMALRMEAKGIPRWMKVWTRVLLWTAVAITGALLLLPAVVPLAGDVAWAAGPVWRKLGHWSAAHTITLVAALVAVGVWRRQASGWDGTMRLFVASALCCLSVLGLPMRAVDAGKRMDTGFRAFAAAFPTDATERARVAAWNFDETIRACLEFYGDAIFPALAPGESPAAQQEQLQQILAGTHPDYDAVVLRLGRREQPFWDAESVTIVTNVNVNGRRNLFYLRPRSE